MTSMATASGDSLPASTRRQRMLELIGRDGFARVADLGEAFRVSEVTVRNDLDLLDEQRAIRRVHGGAVLRGAAEPREPSFEESVGTSAAEKMAIAQRAAAIVRPGSSLILDVGSTTAAIASALVAREELVDVTVITNGLTIALELEQAIPRFQVIVTGGTLRPLQHSLVEPMALTVLRELHADLAFIGCNGVHPANGITNINLPEADLKRVMVEAAERAIVVADGAKIGRTHLGRVAAIDEVDELITGESADARTLDSLRETGLEVVVARV